MIKRPWSFLLLFILFIGCASTTDEGIVDNTLEGTEISALPRPSAVRSNFSPYFSTINTEILLNIQKGTPDSIKRAMASLRSNNDNSEQTNVLIAVCTIIMDYIWTSHNYTLIQTNNLPTNVYTSTIESIQRGIYEGSFDSGDFLSLILPSLTFFSDNASNSGFDEAKKDLEKALSLDGTSVLTLYLLGVVETRLGNYDIAQVYFERAINLDAGNIDIVYAYLDSLLQSGKAQQAYDFSQSLLTRYSSDVRILEFSASAAYDIGNFTEAESLIAQTLQFEPDNVSLLLFRAKVLFELEDYLDVSTLLDVYSRTSTQNKDYLLLRAKLQNSWNKNVTAAIKTIQDALILYPDDIDIQLLAATLASNSSQKIQNKTASEILLSVLEKDPQNIQALGIFVKESIVQQDWQEAYNASSHIMEQDGFTLASVLHHVEICIALNLLSEARATIMPFYVPSSTDENLQQWYIRLLIAEGNNREAGTIIEQLLPSSESRMKSILYFERSRLQNIDERILADLRASLTANTRNEFALYGLYLYYYERLDYSKAQYYLKQVIALNPSNVDALERNAELQALLQ